MSTLPAVVVGRRQRYGCDCGHAGRTSPARLHICPAVAERLLERLSKLDAERRVQHEVHSAVDYHQQIAEVAADGELVSAGGGQPARRHEIDGVELLDSLRQLTDKEYNDDSD